MELNLVIKDGNNENNKYYEVFESKRVLDKLKKISDNPIFYDIGDKHRFAFKIEENIIEYDNYKVYGRGSFCLVFSIKDLNNNLVSNSGLIMKIYFNDINDGVKNLMKKYCEDKRSRYRRNVIDIYYYGSIVCKKKRDSVFISEYIITKKYNIASEIYDLSIDRKKELVDSLLLFIKNIENEYVRCGDLRIDNIGYEEINGVINVKIIDYDIYTFGRFEDYYDNYMNIDTYISEFVRYYNVPRFLMFSESINEETFRFLHRPSLGFLLVSIFTGNYDHYNKYLQNVYHYIRYKNRRNISSSVKMEKFTTSDYILNTILSYNISRNDYDNFVKDNDLVDHDYFRMLEDLIDNCFDDKSIDTIIDIEDIYIFNCHERVFPELIY